MVNPIHIVIFIMNDARRLVGIYAHHYNYIQLHSAIGYVAPIAKLEGRETAIFAERNVSWKRFGYYEKNRKTIS